MRWILVSIVYLFGESVIADALDDGNRPNILIAVADDWSFGHAGAYGNDWIDTPAFDRLANEGALFLNAYTPNAKCAPSRACILTGRNSWQLEAAANHVPYFPLEFRSVFEALETNGYRAGFTGKGWKPGVAEDSNGEPRTLTGQLYNELKLVPLTSGISKTDYAANFEAFLDDAGEGSPWIFWYGSLEPHRGYEYGTGAKIGGKEIDDVDEVPAFWPDNERVRNDMLDYALEVEHFDQHLSKMLDALEKRNQLRNTIVIVTSDHGMPFPRAKGQAYEYSNHVPLLVSDQRIRAYRPSRVERYVSLIDIAPTILEYSELGREESGMARIEGHSLVPIVKGRDSSGRPNFVLIGKERHDVGRPNDWGYPIRGVVKDGYLYLKNFETDRWPAGNPETGYLNTDGGATKSEILRQRREGTTEKYWQLNFGKRPAEELYYLQDDPSCVRNLAYNLDYFEVKDKLAKLMISELREQEDPRLLGDPGYFEAFEYADPDERNFYERFMKGEKLNATWINPSDYEEEEIEDD